MIHCKREERVYTEQIHDITYWILVTNIFEHKYQLRIIIICYKRMFFIQPRRNSVHSLDFFKQTIDYFYGATIEEAEWGTVGAKARVRVNQAVRNQTDGLIRTFLDDGAAVNMKPPFSIVSSSLMQVVGDNFSS